MRRCPLTDSRVEAMRATKPQVRSDSPDNGSAPFPADCHTGGLVCIPQDWDTDTFCK